MSARRGRARPGRYRNQFFPGHRSGSADPILWVAGLVVGGVVVLLAVLTLTHLKTSDSSDDTVVVRQSTSAPAAVVAPASPVPAQPRECYPFQTSC